MEGEPATAAGRSIGITARPSIRVLGKRANPRASEVPESQRQRTISGLDVCQEEELPLLDMEVELFLLQCDEEERILASNETAGGSSSSASAPGKAPSLENVELMTGNCSGVRDVKSGEVLPEEAVRAGRVLELGSMRSFKVWRLVREAGWARQARAHQMGG